MFDAQEKQLCNFTLKHAEFHIQNIFCLKHKILSVIRIGIMKDGKNEWNSLMKYKNVHTLAINCSKDKQFNGFLLALNEFFSTLFSVQYTFNLKMMKNWRETSKKQQSKELNINSSINYYFTSWQIVKHG